MIDVMRQRVGRVLTRLARRIDPQAVTATAVNGGLYAAAGPSLGRDDLSTAAAPSPLKVRELEVILRSDRLAIFERVLAPMTPGRMLDLATGHGKFALVAHRLGWSVTGVDARSERMPDVAGIDWIQADVRHFPVDGYDLITMLGLLYHLELADVLDLLQRAAGTPTIIDTHFAPNPKIVEDGYEGQYFAERTEMPTASIDNKRSFWPHPNALIRMLLDSGYTDIFVLTPPYHPSRTFYMCV